jgi:hypothetical protein
MDETGLKLNSLGLGQLGCPTSCQTMMVLLESSHCLEIYMGLIVSLMTLCMTILTIRAVSFPLDAKNLRT